MRVLVLGGCGAQGRAALYYLSRNEAVERITCADLRPDLLDAFDFVDKNRIRTVRLDATETGALVSVMDPEDDVVLDFLPPHCVRPVAEAAIERGVHLINTNYAYDILDLDDAARRRDVAILPECGLDPGIDLVLYNDSLKRLDKVTRLNSYCGGIPEREACDNPLNYKISWNIEAVLNSQQREATLIADCRTVVIPPADQHENPYIHQIEFPALGRLEAIPNGNALRYAELLGIAGTLCEAGRYTLRWPGWCAFWAPLKRLGFLSREPVAGLPAAVTPFTMVAHLLRPRLQYGSGEKDLCVMVNTVEGSRNGRRRTVTTSLLIERDLTTGLMAMSMGVAYPACIAAEMIVSGEVRGRGVLSPAVDLPSGSFLRRLKETGIAVNETIVPADGRP